MDWLSIPFFLGKLIAIYMVALIIVRFVGKRALGQLGLFDLVIMAGIGDAIIVVAMDQQVSFVKGVFILLLLGGLELFFSMLTYRFKFMASLLEGKPTLLIKDGVLLEKNLAREHISQNELCQELRQQGVAEITQVSKAVLEACGKISVIIKGEQEQEQEQEPEPELVNGRQLLEEVRALRQELLELKECLLLKEN